MRKKSLIGLCSGKNLTLVKHMSDAYPVVRVVVAIAVVVMDVIGVTVEIVWIAEVVLIVEVVGRRDWRPM